MSKSKKGIQITIDWLVLLLVALAVLASILLLIHRMYHQEAPSLLEKVFGDVFKYFKLE